MFSGEDIAQLFRDLGVTHVVSVPDSTIGQWYGALAAAPDLQLVRVCREGEAWGVAAGLHLGGATPMVLIQCTGLFALNQVDRLALEMALHAEAERRALEGELALLERAWREAEEIASIADDLTTPAPVTNALARLKQG